MSLPRRSTRNGTRGYAHLVEVDVPVARVWRALTDPGLIRIWSGQEAQIDPRKGGSYQLGDRNAGGREAHIDIFDVNRRLRLIYLNSADWPPSDSAVVRLNSTGSTAMTYRAPACEAPCTALMPTPPTP